MQNKPFIICGLILLLSFSCKRDFQSTNHQQETTDTVFINLDTIRMFNFGDYFSKIEIIPLLEPYDNSQIRYPTDSISVGKNLYLFYSLNEWKYSDKETKQEDTIFFYNKNRNNILKSITIPYINKYITYYLMLRSRT